MSLVMDASVAVSWCLPDEESTHANSVVALLDGSPALVPPIFMYEVANAVIVARRARRLTEATAAAVLAVVDQLPVAVSSAGHPQSVIVDVSLRYKLSAYDASYLALAAAEGLPLATHDLALRKAAKKAGVALI